MVPRYGNTNVLIYILICSILGSFTVMSCKGLSLGIKEMVSVKPSVSYFYTYMFAFIVILCIVTQMNFLNKSLDIFNTAIVTTVYYVLFTLFVMIASSLLFKELLNVSFQDFVGCLCGFCTIVCALCLIHFFKSTSDISNNYNLKTLVNDNNHNNSNNNDIFQDNYLSNYEKHLESFNNNESIDNCINHQSLDDHHGFSPSSSNKQVHKSNISKNSKENTLFLKTINNKNHILESFKKDNQHQFDQPSLQLNTFLSTKKTIWEKNDLVSASTTPQSSFFKQISVNYNKYFRKLYPSSFLSLSDKYSYNFLDTDADDNEIMGNNHSLSNNENKDFKNNQNLLFEDDNNDEYVKKTERNFSKLINGDSIKLKKLYSLKTGDDDDFEIKIDANKDSL
jgi:hypothetical protein